MARLPSLADKSSIRLLHCGVHLLTLEPASSSFQLRLKPSSYPGALQAFSTGLGLQRHSSLWTEQLPLLACSGSIK